MNTTNATIETLTDDEKAQVLAFAKGHLPYMSLTDREEDAYLDAAARVTDIMIEVCQEEGCAPYRWALDEHPVGKYTTKYDRHHAWIEALEEYEYKDYSDQDDWS